MNVSEKFTEEHEILYYECDTTGKLSIPMLLSMVIKTSESQSRVLGRGSDFVASLGLTWVITQYEIQINRLPKVEEVVKITTEATSYNKYFCYRNFWVHDEAGQECVFIKSTFVLMDIENRKMSSVRPEIIDIYQSEKIKTIERAPKIEAVASDQSLDYRVRFSDIDGNQHVNNSKYLDWMLDVLGYEFLTSHEVTYVNIKFDKEVEYGNQVSSYWETTVTDEKILTKHQVKNDQILCAETNLNWRKID